MISRLGSGKRCVGSCRFPRTVKRACFRRNRKVTGGGFRFFAGLELVLLLTGGLSRFEPGDSDPLSLGLFRGLRGEAGGKGGVGSRAGSSSIGTPRAAGEDGKSVEPRFGAC